MKSFKEFILKEESLVDAIKRANKEGDLTIINKKVEEIEEIQNNCKDQEKKQNLEKVLKAFKELFNKAKKKSSIVAEATGAEAETTKPEEEIDKVHQDLWDNAEKAEELAAAAEKVDKVVNSINIITDKHNNNVANANARSEANKLLKALLEYLKGDTKTLLKVAEFIKVAAKSKGEGKILSLQELVDCFNEAKKNGLESANLLSKDITSEKFKNGLIVGLGILFLKKHANSPDFTTQGMAKDSEYANDDVLIRISSSFYNINIDETLKNEIGLEKLSTSDKFIEAIINFVDKLSNGKLVDNKAGPNNKTDISGSDLLNSKTNADETQSDLKSKTDETQSDLKSKNDVKANSEEIDNKTNSKENYKLFRLNSKSSPEEINDAVEEFFGTGDKGKLEHYLIKVEMQKSENDAIGQERKNYNLKNLEKYKRDHEDVEDNGNNVSENYVLNTLYNNPLINEGFKNFVRNVHSSLPTIGRINIGNSKASERSWNNCISKMKEAQAEYEKKAITISGKATNPNCSIPQKHSLLTKLKTLAGEYNVHLNGIFEQYRKRNGYNAIGSALHDIKSDLYKHQINKFEDSKETNAYREKLMSKESVKKAISNLSTENLDKITSVGGIGNKYLFAYAVLNIAKNDRDSLLARDIINGKGSVEKGLKNILDNNYEAFGVNKDTNLYTFSDLLFNSSKDIQNWLEENSKQYEKRLRTHPLFDELKLLQSYGKTWLERVSQQNRSGADFKKEFEINESVSSISFKEFYILYEDGQPNPEPLCKNDKEKSILATLFLINNSSSDAAKEAAAKYLASKNEDKMGYTANDYLTAAKSYREDNANNNKYIELCNFFNKLLVSPGANNHASQNQNQGQGQGQNQGQGTQNAQKQTPVNDSYLRSKGINNYQDFKDEMDKLGNYSVVTSDAVGESKIPDRLYRKIIRKKIDSFV